MGASVEPAVMTEIKVEGSMLRVSLSKKDIALLAIPNREGVYFATHGEPPLRYYVEKDFPCAHPGAPEAAEPDSETFVPPLGFKERHTF